MKVTPYQQLTPMFENENTTKGLALGQDVYFLGFPYQYDQLLSSIPGDSKPLPFVKKACLSTILTDNKSILLLDGHNNPGFSGGPVCFKEIGSGKKAMAIAGIVSGYRFDRQYVFDENDTQTKSYVKDNTGIIIVHAKTYLFRNSHMAHGNWNDGMRAHTRRKAYEKANENWRRNRHFRGRTNEQQRTLSGCRLQQCRAAFYHRQSGCNSHSREYADRDARRSMDERS